MINLHSKVSPYNPSVGGGLLLSIPVGRVVYLEFANGQSLMKNAIAKINLTLCTTSSRDMVHKT